MAHLLLSSWPQLSRCKQRSYDAFLYLRWHAELVLGTQAWRWPVLETHAQTEAVPFEDFLNLCQRFLAEIRCPQKLYLCTLHKVTDIHDVLGFEAVRRTYSQFELVNRAQQDRINLIFCLRCCAVFLALQVNEYRQLILENASRTADSFFRIDRGVSLDFD